jgi:hypothetical protein
LKGDRDDEWEFGVFPVLMATFTFSLGEAKLNEVRSVVTNFSSALRF